MISSDSTSIFSVLLLQLIATAGMVGVIWFVQLITYPQFAEMEGPGFYSYHQDYSNRVTWIVAPLMLIELMTSFLAVLWLWESSLRSPAIAGFAIVLALWALTAFVQVPQHGRLAEVFSIETVRELVKWNWCRTILWTVRLFLVGVLIYRWVGGAVLPK